MTLLTALLLLILFLAFFVYFSGLNPQDITIFYFADQHFTTSAAILVIGCVLLGLVLGSVAHFYQTFIHQLKHWKNHRREKKAREVTAIYREGVGRLLSGDIKKAHILLQKALDRDPSRVESYLALANVHVQGKNPQQGEALLLKAKELEPRSLEVLFKLATTYEEMNKIGEAGKVYEDILAIDSGNRKALRNFRDLYIKQEKWKEALDLQKRVLKTVPKSPRLEEEKQKYLSLRYEVAALNLAENQIDKANSEFKDIIKQAPDFTPARVSLGDAYQAQGRPEDAAKVWQEGYRVLAKSVFLSRLEDLYMGAEDPATLLSFYRSYLAENKDDLMLRLFYGKLCLRLEMVDEALEQLYAVESAGAEFPQIHLLLAEAHRRRDRIDESINEYKKALGVNTQLSLGYVCDTCGTFSPEWQSRCQKCGTWGSFSFAGRRSIQKARPVEMREIHHGEREK
jgi:lipopolysaccharide biosynthesis regulator YciM